MSSYKPNSDSVTKIDTWENDSNTKARSIHFDGSGGIDKISIFSNNKKENAEPVIHTHYSDGTDKIHTGVVIKNKL